MKAIIGILMVWLAQLASLRRLSPLTFQCDSFYKLPHCLAVDDETYNITCVINPINVAKILKDSQTTYEDIFTNGSQVDYSNNDVFYINNGTNDEPWLDIRKVYVSHLQDILKPLRKTIINQTAVKFYISAKNNKIVKDGSVTCKLNNTRYDGEGSFERFVAYDGLTTLRHYDFPSRPIITGCDFDHDDSDNYYGGDHQVIKLNNQSRNNNETYTCRYRYDVNITTPLIETSFKYCLIDSHATNNTCSSKDERNWIACPKNDGFSCVFEKFLKRINKTFEPKKICFRAEALRFEIYDEKVVKIRNFYSDVLCRSFTSRIESTEVHRKNYIFEIIIGISVALLVVVTLLCLLKTKCKRKKISIQIPDIKMENTSSPAIYNQYKDLNNNLTSRDKDEDDDDDDEEDENLGVAKYTVIKHPSEKMAIRPLLNSVGRGNINAEPCFIGSATSDGMTSQQTTKTIVSYDDCTNAYNSHNIAKPHIGDSEVAGNLGIITNESADGYKQIDFAYESGGDDDSNVSNKYKNDNKDYVSVSSLENQIAGSSNNNIKNASDNNYTNKNSNYSVVKAGIKYDKNDAEISVMNQSNKKNYKSPDAVSSGYITIFTDKGSDNEEDDDINDESNLASNYSTVVLNGPDNVNNSSGCNEIVNEATSTSNENSTNIKDNTSSATISPYTTLFQIAK